MDNSVTIVIRDLVTGIGRNGLTVWLRHKTDNFASNVIQATAVSGKQGVYEAPNVPFNLYKLWVNETEDNTFGGTNGRWLPDGDDVIRISGTDYTANNLKITDLADATAATNAMNRQSSDARFVKLDGTNDPDIWLKLSGGTMTGDINMDGNQITDLPDPTTDGGPVIKSYFETQAARKSANNTFTGTNSFNDDVVFAAAVAFSTELPLCDEVPSSDNHLANKKYVDDVAAAIGVTPFQESPNVMRLIPGGLTETNKVYTTWPLCQNAAREYPASDSHRICIEIKGAGSGGTEIAVSNGAIPGNSAFNNFVSIRGENQNIKLTVDDAVFSITAGKVIIENVTISRYDDGDGNPQFQNFIFKDVYFDFDTASLTFNGCTFRNCFIKNTNTITFTSCKGGNVITTGTLPATIQGWGEIPSSDF